jgi:site-specific DNA-methyltransferase (adenine-specific)
MARGGGMTLDQIIDAIGIEPYYREPAGVIYNCDCMDVLPLIPEKSIDLVLTDPPYGIDYQSARRTDKSQWKPKIYGDDEYPSWIFDLIKPEIAFMAWCRWDVLEQMPKPKSLIVWDKGNHSMGDLSHEFGRQWEGCAFYPGPNHSFTKRPKDIFSFPKIPPERLIHPNEKPKGIMLLLIYCHPGYIVFDPFMGTGSTLQAAKQLGRKFIGIEIEEKYCQIAVDRLKQEQLPL